MSILLGILTFFLIVVSVLLILLVLMQKAKTDAGAGAALGGGMTESAFGADTDNVLSRGTIKATIAFFILSFVLYLGHLYQRNHASGEGDALPSIQAPVVTAPAPENAPAPGEAMPAEAPKTDSTK